VINLKIYWTVNGSHYMQSTNNTVLPKVAQTSDLHSGDEAWNVARNTDYVNRGFWRFILSRPANVGLLPENQPTTASSHGLLNLLFTSINSTLQFVLLPAPLMLQTDRIIRK
jgi:hypothetical protein